MNEIATSINSSSEGAELSSKTAHELVKLSEQLTEHIRRFKTHKEAAKPQIVARNNRAA
jgi:methyl-accepting chemotaxis protein